MLWFFMCLFFLVKLGWNRFCKLSSARWKWGVVDARHLGTSESNDPGGLQLDLGHVIDAVPKSALNDVPD